MTNFSDKVSFIWSVADLLRAPYKPPQSGSEVLVGCASAHPAPQCAEAQPTRFVAHPSSLIPPPSSISRGVANFAKGVGYDRGREEGAAEGCSMRPKLPPSKTLNAPRPGNGLEGTWAEPYSLSGWN